MLTWDGGLVGKIYKRDGSGTENGSRVVVYSLAQWGLYCEFGDKHRFLILYADKSMIGVGRA